jgi:lysophospholipase L1-like esterase
MLTREIRTIPFITSWRPLALALSLLLVITLASCGSSPASASTTTARTSGTATPATLTYVALGASDAYGVGTDDPDRESWPTVLSQMLGQHVHLINLGIPGEVVSQALSTELPIALDAKPNIITVWLAVNDLADGVTLTNYAQQLHSLLSALRQDTHARIFVGNVPDLTLIPHFYGYDPTALRTEVQQWNAAIATICSQTGATLVDIYSAWNQIATHPEYISNDGFHPSAAGARQLAELFDQVIAATPAA